MTSKETENKKPQNEEKKDQTNQSVNLAILGGVMGAGIGLLSSPGTSKKVFKSMSESELMRVAGRELKRTAQEIITEQALNGIRQSATGYISKYEGKLLSPKKKIETNSNEEDQSSQYEEIKEENKNLNDRLERIENMLSDLVDSKKK